MKFPALLGVAAGLLTMSSCGYRVAGHADTLPTTLKTIAIPAFTNVTSRYKLTDRLPEAIAREFITRTRYRVVSDVNQADAVLRGGVVNYSASATIFDPISRRASGVELMVTVQVSLVDRASGKVLFTRPNFEVRERYEISVDASQYFEESDTALSRVSEQVAQRVVSAILSDF